MRVLQLIDSLEAGGAERVAVNVANGLASRIEQSFLCATRKEGTLKETISKEVEYLFLDKQRTVDFKAVVRLLRYVQSQNIDIIHAHSSSFFLATMVKLLHRKVTIVWHDHYGESEFLDDRPTKILAICSRYFTHSIAVNTSLETWASQRFKGVPTSYVPNFAVHNYVTPQTVLEGVTGKRVLHLANLRAQKDHITLIKAFKHVLEACPDWTLHLVGKDFNDAYSASIKSTLKRLELEQSVFIYGSRNDSDAIIKQSSLGVLSSASEGLPIALLEYGLHGLPVVSTQVGDCERLIRNGDTGCLVPSQNEQALAKALILLMKNENLRLRYSKNLNAHIATHFSEEFVFKKLLSIYKRCLS
ncbi:glycosyltransferase family 4 protein [Bizionia gelidisalsuginis]|uniref:Glycosyltransferase family 4 protein n=1 Tax=Bizionia gelidisalsuginis TaxID=291188 RepID=A0ABY3MDJ4_9FLAO|nr:glycosyltransferase [Bizionia gelidisalsuginis]TYC16999.1 glycosyltransferase family 4 protein [Bizionia gelidisalsuginis]